MTQRTVITTRETTYRMELSRKDIISLAQAMDRKVPNDAEVYVQIPGGGDWSNEALDIGEHPVRVVWTTREQTVDDRYPPPARDD